MKNLFLILILLFCLLTAGCFDSQRTEYISSSTPDISRIDVEYESSEESKEASTIPPEEIYEFLASEYTVTSTRESFGTVYVCVYYFVEGTVRGAKLMTTLPDEETAENYFEIVREDYHDAVLDGLTVTNYLDDDEHYYYGYDLDKLKFVLEKSGYEYTVNFDEKLFTDEFYTSLPD